MPPNKIFQLGEQIKVRNIDLEPPVLLGGLNLNIKKLVFEKMNVN